MQRRIMDSNGIETKQAPSDADLLIATTAVQSFITRPTIIFSKIHLPVLSVSDYP
jgi:hypothetical protein